MILRSKLATGLPTTLILAILVMALSLGSSGCINKMILDKTIASTRIGAGAADTIGDYELARAAASAGVLQFEGMHRLAPDNEDALFLLMKGWAGYGYAFPMDDYEVASLADDDKLASYHKKRAKLAFDRSIAYGIELIGHDAEGFEPATKNADTLKAWLKDKFTTQEGGENLFWLGSAWLGRTVLLKDQPEVVAKLYVGVAVLERSRELAPTYMSYGATSTLAAYHARSPIAELDEAKRLLDFVLEKTHHGSLGVQLNYAQYACAKSDQALYEKMLNEIISADDPDPNERLLNTIAKRRAQRALTKAAMEECGFGVNAPKPADPSPAK